MAIHSRIAGTGSYLPEKVLTNADLEKGIQEGRFREDLYYRLNVIPIFIPALRERPEDIGPLIEHFIAKFSTKNNKKIEGITKEARDLCLSYSWPGNVRELENAIENAVVMTENNWLQPEDLPIYIKTISDKTGVTPRKELESGSYKEQLDYAEKMIIKKVLLEAKGNKTHAAGKLGFSIRTMRNKVKKYGL